MPSLSNHLKQRRQSYTNNKTIIDFYNVGHFEFIVINGEIFYQQVTGSGIGAHVIINLLFCHICIILFVEVKLWS
jgi:hypothetical protein